MKKRTAARKRSAARIAPKDPLMDGLIEVPKDSHGRRMWRKLTDGELVGYAKRFIEENGIKRKVELRKLDHKLYDVLKKRKLIGKINFNKKWKGRDWGDIPVDSARRILWSKISDDTIVAYVKEFMRENGINTKGQLQKRKHSLYEVLRKRGLLEMVGFKQPKRKERRWKQKSDDEIVAYAIQLIEEKGIRTVKELEKFDSGLLYILRKRKLLDELGLERKAIRVWKDTTDDQLIEYTKQIIEKNRIINRKGLERFDHGLYQVLIARKLMDQVFAEIEAQRNADGNKQAAEEMFAAVKEMNVA